MIILWAFAGCLLLSWQAIALQFPAFMKRIYDGSPLSNGQSNNNETNLSLLAPGIQTIYTSTVSAWSIYQHTYSLPRRRHYSPLKNRRFLIPIEEDGLTLGTVFQMIAHGDVNVTNFSSSVGQMIANIGVDGIHLNWRLPCSVPGHEIEVYTRVLEEIRKQIGRHKIISISVPGRLKQMGCFTRGILARLGKVVTVVNVKTYNDAIYDWEGFSENTHFVPDESTFAYATYLDNGLRNTKVEMGYDYQTRYHFMTTDAKEDPLISCITTVHEDAHFINSSTYGIFTSLLYNNDGKHCLDEERIIPLSRDNRCGPSFQTRCPNGRCCSEKQQCTRNVKACGNGCLHSFGECNTVAPVIASWRRAKQDQSPNPFDRGGSMRAAFDSTYPRLWYWQEPILNKLESRQYLVPYHHVDL